jgi:phage-related protein
VSFDAGTIIAHLDLDDKSFDDKLKKAEASQKDFENKPHKIKVAAEFDHASLTKARQAFTQLDKMISADAAQRLKSGGSGSVLGALNSLFSTQQVAGAPTPSQSAQQGMLGRMVSQGGSVGGANTSTSANRSNTGVSHVVSGLLGGIAGGIIGGGGGGGGGGSSSRGGGGNQGLGTGLFQGIGPGVLGLGTRVSTIGALGASALGAIPAVGALGAGLGVLGGGAAFLIATNKKVKDSAKDMISSVEATFKQAVGPLVKPLEEAFSQLAGFMKSIEPELHQVFAAAAPLLKPFTDGLEALVKGLLPGLVTILKGAEPVFSMLAKFLGQFGSDLGKTFAIFTPALKASSVIFGALLSLLSGLFPVIAKLADIFATSLAPVFSDFAQVIKSLEPVLVIVGQILGSLAQAILGDLVSAFGALAKLLIDISPALQLLAKSLGQAFNVLENSGVFATLGDALEQIAPLLANMITLLIKQLAPFLPQLVGLFGDLSTIMITLFAAGLGTIIKGITALLTHFPILSKLLLAAGAAFLVFDIAANANPIGLIVIAIVALIGVATLLVTHWKQVWGDVKAWAEDAWNFIYKGFGKYLLPLLGPAGLIALGAIELAQHWKTIWDTIMGVVTTVEKFFTTTWNAIESTAKSIWNAIASFFTSWWNAEVSGIRSIVSTIESVLSTAWNTVYSGIRSVWTSISGWFTTITGKITTTLRNWGSSLLSVGKAAINDLWNGMKSVGSSVLSWVKNTASSIVNDIKKIFGIASPSAVFFDIGKNMMQGLINGLKSKVMSVVNAATGAGGAAGSAAGGGAVAALMKSMAAARGWSGAQWTALYNVEMREAGFNMTAQNPGSGAYGLAQFINGPGEYATYGGNVNTAAGQITGMLNYIAQRYGSPAAAWQHELNYGWYDSGGWLMPGGTNMTGQPEAVLTPPQSQAFVAMAAEARRSGYGGSSTAMDRKLDELIAAVKTSAGRTGVAMGKVLGGVSAQAAARGYWGGS